MMKACSQFLVLFSLSVLTLGCQNQPENGEGETLSGLATGAPVHQVRNELVDASCGQCQFDLPGSGCDLAVRVNGKAYFVDGTSIDEHGDAHAAGGFCNAVRQARVTGHVRNGRFVTEQFELIDDEID